MKATVVDWNRACEKRLSDLGYRHLDVVTGDMSCLLGHVAKIFASGLNTMLLHNDDNSMAIAVDTRQFQQR